MDLHPGRVGLGLFHRVFSLVAPDLEDLEIRFGRDPPEIERRLELPEARLRLFERLVVLLRLDLREHRVLEVLELGAGPRALRLLQLALIARARGGPLVLLLPDLLLEVVQLGPAVESVRQLLLAVELDEQIAGLDGRAAGNQLRDHERVRVRTRQPGRRHRRRLHGLDGAADPDGTNEVLPLERGRRLAAARGPRLRPVAAGRPERGRACQNQERRRAAANIDELLSHSNLTADRPSERAVNSRTKSKG